MGVTYPLVHPAEMKPGDVVMDRDDKGPLPRRVKSVRVIVTFDGGVETSYPVDVAIEKIRSDR